eukprot:3848786-Rhodomonas_salina.2
MGVAGSRCCKWNCGVSYDGTGGGGGVDLHSYLIIDDKVAPICILYTAQTQPYLSSSTCQPTYTANFVRTFLVPTNLPTNLSLSACLHSFISEALHDTSG